MAQDTSSGDRRLAGRRVLITGAASGIGRATAELFAAKGARLALVDANAEALQEIAAKLDADAWPFDLTDVEGVGNVVDQAAGKMGGLDGVVNCAGLGTARPLVDMDLAFLRRVSAINFEAPIMICKAALPLMQAAGGGTVVNIASGQGILPNAPYNTAYCATKGGLIAFTKNLAVEAAAYGVRANAVAPGVTNTPMAAFTFKDYADPSDAPFVQQYALKRVADPVEIANAILFLTSDESSYVTGSALAVDGGRCFH